jgi:hypothetical protein
VARREIPKELIEKVTWQFVGPDVDQFVTGI